MSKARLSSILVLFLGFSALFLFGQLSPVGSNEPKANAGPGEMSVQTNVTKTFMAQDGANSCTVMSIYNPTLANANVKIVGCYYHGAAYCEWTFQVPKKSVVRVCSDYILTNDSSWASFVFTDFGFQVAFAKVTCPSTLKIDAYIAWNGNSDYYDPEYINVTRPLPLF
jgi:hypothetical protein